MNEQWRELSPIDRDEPWRYLGFADRTAMLERFQREQAERLFGGLRKYGPVFTSRDLFAEAREELFDALHYVTVAEAERDWLKARVELLERMLTAAGLPLPEHNERTD